jgi:hypothetical protein
MFGDRAGRSLLQTRRGTSFFTSAKAEMPREASSELLFDFGPPPPVPQRFGVSVVGAMTYVTNFNIQVERASLPECQAAASRIRSEFGVHVMALPHEEGTIEIGCNLQAAVGRDSPSPSSVLQVAGASLPHDARILKSYVVGLTPSEALSRARC